MANLVGQPDFGKGAGNLWTPVPVGVHDQVPGTVTVEDVGGDWVMSWNRGGMLSPAVPGGDLAPGDVLTVSFSAGTAMTYGEIKLYLDGAMLSKEETYSPDITSFTGTVPAGYVAGPDNGPRVQAENTDGFYTPFKLKTVTVTAEPGEAPPPPDTGPVWEDLAAKTAAFLGRPDDEALKIQAAIHAEIVTGYVAGYTRGRGFSFDGEPNQQLRFVIVSATARLANNPEQVTYYQAADYTEKPAVLAGWTLPELGILHNFRRRSA